MLQGAHGVLALRTSTKPRFFLGAIQRVAGARVEGSGGNRL
jgi:hypothetical protein